MSETVAQVQMAKQVTPMSTAGRTVRILEPLSLDQFLLFLLHLLQSFQLHLKLHLMLQLLQKKHLNSQMLVRQMLLNLLNNQSLKHLSLLQLQFWPELSRKWYTRLTPRLLYELERPTLAQSLWYQDKLMTSTSQFFKMILATLPKWFNGSNLMDEP